MRIKHAFSLSDPLVCELSIKHRLTHIPTYTHSNTQHGTAGHNTERHGTRATGHGPLLFHARFVLKMGIRHVFLFSSHD